MKKSNWVVLWLGLLSLFIWACSDNEKTAGGSTEDSGVVAVKDRDVAGVAQKGPFVKGSAVTVYELEGASLNPTGRIFTTKVSSDKGDYSFQKLNLVSQYVVFEVQGYYRNEVSGEITAGTVSLNALVDLTETESVNINVLTHMENERVQELVRNGGGFSASKKQAKNDISSAFGMEAPANGFESLNALESGEENANLLAVSMMLQSDLNVGELSERLASVSLDLATDGEWNDESVKGEISTWIANTNLDSVYANVNAWGYSDTPVEKSDLYNEFVEENKSQGSSSSESEVSSSSQAAVDGETIVDGRDGAVYRIVSIGSQVWMAENLRYVPEGLHSSCYNDDESSCDVYGRLYLWSDAMDSAAVFSTTGAGCGYGSECNASGTVLGVCPDGWHLPNDEEWNVLFTEAGGVDVAGKILKATSGWDGDGNGTDSLGFAALPAGELRDDGGFNALGSYVNFWSSSESDGTAHHWYIDTNRDGVYLGNNDKRASLSIRCLKD